MTIKPDRRHEYVPDTVSTETQAEFVEGVIAELLKRCTQRALDGQEEDCFDVYKQILKERT